MTTEKEETKPELVPLGDYHGEWFRDGNELVVFEPRQRILARINPSAGDGLLCSIDDDRAFELLDKIERKDVHGKSKPGKELKVKPIFEGTDLTALLTIHANAPQLTGEHVSRLMRTIDDLKKQSRASGA